MKRSVLTWRSRHGRSILARLGIMALGVGLAVSLIEVFFRLFPTLLPLEVQRLAHRGRYDVYREQGSFVIGLDDAYYGPRLAPGLDNYLLIIQDTTFHLSTGMRFADAGFRDDFGTGPTEAIAIGDSFTGCYGVESEDCWVNLLARESGISIANLGMIASSGTQQVRILERWGMQYNPRLILWGFYGNDPANNSEFEQMALSSEAAVENSISFEEWLHRNSIVFELLAFLRARVDLRRDPDQPGDWLYRDDNLRLRFHLTCDLFDVNADKIRRGLEIHEENIKHAKELADDNGAQLVLLLFPTKEITYWHLISDAYPRWAEGCDPYQIYAKVAKTSTELGIPVLDLTEPFQQHAQQTSEQTYYEFDTHWNPSGNGLAEQIIQEFLIDQGFVTGIGR